MSYGERALDNPINWSFRIGRLWGIDLRVHIAFVICALVLLSMELPKRGSEDVLRFDSALYFALGTYALLFGVVLLHEFGHCFGARRVGGEADEILLWPLGGLANTSPPHNPRAFFITTAAGPLVNVAICMLAALAIRIWIGRWDAVPWNPLHPLIPANETLLITISTGQQWLIRLFGVSYLLLLFNLLPIFPFDGGRLLQAFLWHRSNYHASMLMATSTGMIGAIAVGLFGLFIEESWLMMMIAVFGYMTCWQARRMLREQGEFGGAYDFDTSHPAFDSSSRSAFDASSRSGFDTTTPRSAGREGRAKRLGLIKRWRIRRAAARAEAERLRLEAGQQTVEDILKKVSREGVNSLTAGERRILEEETQRRRELSATPEEVDE